ncbi:hypothetical protein ABW19_dt0200366 [Dactylella cylindrospora]|nr:hypothetical protein ABW19_dt0200366 [Dactylella cylindrospora]
MTSDKKPPSKKPASSEGSKKPPATSGSVEPASSAKPPLGLNAPIPKFPTFGAPLNLTVPKNKAIGCEHLFVLFKKPGWGVEDTKERYNKKLDQMIDYRKEVKACSTCHDVPASLYLCLECPELNCFDCADQHAKGEEHEFSMNYRVGSIWCHTCRDFIYDSDLERVRCAHEKVIAATTFRKRKRPTADESRYIENNSQPPMCKATGLRGMVNFGNTCWINVSLLSLVTNPLMRNYFMSRPHEKKECDDEGKFCFVCQLTKIFDGFYAEDCLGAYNPMEMIVAIAKRLPEFHISEQEDPSDFLSNLFNKICDDIKQKEANGECKCIMHQIFIWKEKVHKTCKSCKAKSVTDNSGGPFMVLAKLPDQWRDTLVGKKRRLETKSEKPAPTLKILLDEHFKRNENVKFNCEKCDTTGNIAKWNSIKSFPMVMTCYFPWMKQLEDTSAEHVDIPVSIDMKEYSTPVRAKQCKAEDAPSVWYDLFFTTVHHGTERGGHYVCYSRDRDNQWYHFNDTAVHLSSDDEVTGMTPMMVSYILRKLPEAET